MTKLIELCSLIRSKNAGPFTLTFDVMFASEANYQRAKRAQPITAAMMAKLFRQQPEDVLVVYHDNARAIKASMPRPVVQGDLADGDCYGGQQYVELLELGLPDVSKPVSAVPADHLATISTGQASARALAMALPCRGIEPAFAALNRIEKWASIIKVTALLEAAPARRSQPVPVHA